VRDGRRSSEAEDQKPTVTSIGLTHKDIHEARNLTGAQAEREAKALARTERDKGEPA